MRSERCAASTTSCWCKSFLLGSSRQVAVKYHSVPVCDQRRGDCNSIDCIESQQRSNSPEWDTQRYCRQRQLHFSPESRTLFSWRELIELFTRALGENRTLTHCGCSWLITCVATNGSACFPQREGTGIGCVIAHTCTERRYVKGSSLSSLDSDVDAPRQQVRGHLEGCNSHRETGKQGQPIHRKNARDALDAQVHLRPRTGT